MSQPARTPRISNIQWGRIEVEGHGSFKDAKIFPGGARSWVWTDTGTHHVPGVQPTDVRELIAAGARRIILSTGYHEMLQVMPDTLALLRESGIVAEVLETGAAVARFNELRKTQAVGGLFHSTC